MTKLILLHMFMIIFCLASIKSKDMKRSTIPAQKTDASMQELWNELIALDSKIASHKKTHTARLGNLDTSSLKSKRSDSKKSRNFDSSLTSIPDTQYLTQKLTKISEIPLDPKKAPLKVELIQTRQHYIKNTEISHNLALMVVYPREMIFYDLGGNILSIIKLNYEILFIKDSQGVDNSRTLDIISKDLYMHSYN